jgi:hypothetical protein
VLDAVPKRTVDEVWTLVPRTQTLPRKPGWQRCSQDHESREHSATSGSAGHGSHVAAVASACALSEPRALRPAGLLLKRQAAQLRTAWQESPAPPSPSTGTNGGRCHRELPALLTRLSSPGFPVLRQACIDTGRREQMTISASRSHLMILMQSARQIGYGRTVHGHGRASRFVRELAASSSSAGT